jgi:branched-chain amino acid transport system substrate-binding protein
MMLRTLSLTAAVALLPFAVDAAEPIKIGALLTYSGVYATIGTEMTQAMEIAFAEAGNAVDGRPIEIIRADTEGRPNIALDKAKELVGTEHVDVLVGPVSSGESVALRDFIAETKTPTVAPNGIADPLTRDKCTPYLIPMSFSTLQFTKPAAEWLFAHGIKTVYTLAPDYVGGRQIMESFTKWFDKAGGKVVGSDFTPFQKTTDWGPYLAKVKEAKPDAVFVFYAGGEAINFIKQQADFKLQDSVKLTGEGWTVSPLFLPAEGEAAVGFTGILNYAPTLDNPESKAFQAKYEEKYHRPASEFGAQAYDAAKFILAGLQATKGKTDDHAALVKAIRAAKLDGPRGPISIDAASDHVVQNMYMLKVEKGAKGPELKVLETIPQVKDEPSICKLVY